MGCGYVRSWPLTAQLCDAPSPSQYPYSHCAGVAGAQRCEHNNDLHACTEDRSRHYCQSVGQADAGHDDSLALNVRYWGPRSGYQGLLMAGQRPLLRQLQCPLSRSMQTKKPSIAQMCNGGRYGIKSPVAVTVVPYDIRAARSGFASSPQALEKSPLPYQQENLSVTTP
jgi:hypothetical protein